MEKKLNIFTSKFKIRAHLKEKEPLIQTYWQKIAREKKSPAGKKTFIIHAGPPYANGGIHIGHALNMILKDFALRFQELDGNHSSYLPGWDTHGLPIALAVSKEKQKASTISQFRKNCQQFALSQVAKQKKQLARLGLAIDFNHHYLTLDKNYVAKELEIFAKIVEKKLIFYSFKPVYWSWSSQTALAETEVEYQNITTESVFLKFPLISEEKKWKNTSFLVWTTTLWTIPENKFLAVKENGLYCLIATKKKGEKLIIGKLLWKKLAEQFPSLKGKILTELLGKELINTLYHHPYLEQSGKVLAANYVNFTEGTGIVHVAPEFGLDDFQLSQKENFPLITTVNKDGKFNQNVADQELVGKFYLTSQKIIKEKIGKKNNLFATLLWNHQYPHDWRTAKPVIYLASKQLYLNLLPLTETILQTIKEINWIPPWGEKRLTKLLAKRKDWCLSRQRSWGVPIPVFFDQNDQPVLEEKLIRKISQLIALHGDNIWWEWPLTKLLSGEEINHYKIVKKGNDTFDVWFDAGCSAIITSKEEKIAAIWEGNDQYRGWFNSLLIINVALGKKWNIDTILTHGFVNDLTGKKMSKSKGNVIDPNDVCQTWGADVLRLWVVSGNYFHDLNLGKLTLEKIGKTYLKIRNSFRFLINNLADFNPQKELTKEITTIDHYLLVKLDLLIEEIKIDYQAYQYHLIYTKLINFITVWLSNFYFAYSKDILYTLNVKAKARKQIQTIFFYLLKKLTVVFSPILVHTMEEVFQVNNEKWQASIHWRKWPAPVLEKKANQELILEWKFLLELKTALNQFWEAKIQTGEMNSSKNCQIMVYIDPNYLLFSTEKEYRQWETDYHWEKAKNWKKTNSLITGFKEKFQQMLWLKNFFKVYQITFLDQPQKYQIKSGSFSYQKIGGKLCQRCQQNLAKKENFCQSCEEIIKK